MATAAVQHIAPAPQPSLYQSSQPELSSTQSKKEQYKPHNVEAEFNYYLDPGDGSLPSPNYVDKPDSYNEKPVDTRRVLVHDIRGSEDEYTLDKTGFQVHKHVSKEKDFLDEDRIKAEYYPEVEQLLKDVTGASKIFIFDHTIRRPAPEDEGNKSANITRGPVQRVHIDQSFAAAPNRVTHHLPDEASHLLAGRFQIINVWRPIKPIFKDPLGVADATTVSDADDLIPVKLVYPHRTGETFTVKPGKEKPHAWYYMYGQRPDEVMLIKCFDSKTDGRAKGVPHSAFVNPETEDREPRESIEVRCLVFHPDDKD
ncbi:MAG: hypothetical protein M1812_002622 [Candelaria pacifica]|nr:MAG: hypothetical protein M1812_002622 [Candelaria pacifica]